jgi:hypothetical protein
MRKQDRIANQQQSRPNDPAKKEMQPESRPQEQVKASASTAPRPNRPGGKLPLPD